MEEELYSFYFASYQKYDNVHEIYAFVGGC